MYFLTLYVLLSCTVRTGFTPPPDGCIPEGVLQEICLTTVGTPAVDTVLDVLVSYDTATPEGKLCDCIENTQKTALS